MGLFQLLRRIFSSKQSVVPRPAGDDKGSRCLHRERLRRRTPGLIQLRYSRQERSTADQGQEVPGPEPPYCFANFTLNVGSYWDLSRDGDSDRLAQFGLPHFHTPEELAEFLEIPLGKLAWLIDRFSICHRPDSVERAHYHYRWIKKRSGGWRLIEAPKPMLKLVQQKILVDVLNKIPPHATAHGFVPQRSIVTNAQAHLGSSVLLKFDLENFYSTVSFARVVAMFRNVGYSRETAIWLGRITTSALPINMFSPDGNASTILPFLPRHLPQGAPTSPALANLSAFALDIRLSGLARSFGATYTRYADDLTFSGPDSLLRALPTFIPLVSRIIRSEAFRINKKKRKVIRSNQRQTVTGVVVNERVNISRRQYDQLKAILHNCVRYGPASQNRDGHPNFAAHLQGRIAHVMQLNRSRGLKLIEMYERVDWSEELSGNGQSAPYR